MDRYYIIKFLTANTSENPSTSLKVKSKQESNKENEMYEKRKRKVVNLDRTGEAAGK